MPSHCSIHRFFGPAAVLAALSAGVGTTPAQDKSTDVAPWHRVLAAARQESQDGGKLLLIAFNADLDGESGNHAMATGVYRDPDFLGAVADVVTLIASVDRHADAGSECPRFGRVTCDDHQLIEKHARRFLFGDVRELIAPQHVLLYPDGSVAWHSVYQVSTAEIVRELRQAKSTWKQNERVRASRHLKRFKELVQGAEHDRTRYLMLKATLCHATEELFPKMLSRVRDPQLAERLLRDLAADWPADADARLAKIDGRADKSLQPIVAELRGRLATEKVASFDTGSDTAKAEDAEMKRLGEAQPIPRVHFTDGVERNLLGEPGQVTVLLFFLPDDELLAAKIDRWNRFVARTEGSPVRTFALGASIIPQTDLPKTESAGFAFPAANYLYEESVAPYGVTTFPRAVILDDDGHVVFNGDAYNEYEMVVKRVLAQRNAARITARR